MTCWLQWFVELETICRIALWRTFGRIQWHVIPEPCITLQGAATWWIHCHDSRATCYIAGCKNSIRHIENRFFAIFYFILLFLMQFGLWRAAAFVSSAIHLLITCCWQNSRAKKTDYCSSLRGLRRPLGGRRTWAPKPKPSYVPGGRRDVVRTFDRFVILTRISPREVTNQNDGLPRSEKQYVKPFPYRNVTDRQTDRHRQIDGIAISISRVSVCADAW